MINTEELFNEFENGENEISKESENYLNEIMNIKNIFKFEVNMDKLLALENELDYIEKLLPSTNNLFDCINKISPTRGDGNFI